MSGHAPRAAAVVVVGSANVDLVYRVRELPQPGETVMAISSARHPGGKGNNQAIAAARTGVSTAFVAAVGADEGGDLLSSVLADAGVDAHLRRVAMPTGTALITVDDHGENSIVVDSGANGELTELTAAERSIIAAARILLVQLELPMATVVEAAAAARAAGVLVAVNAAPFRPLPDSLVRFIDMLIVNEGEARAAGPAVTDRVPTLVVTRGRRGAEVRLSDGKTASLPAPAVNAVDTTGAGDTFCGAFVAALAEGQPLPDAGRLAVTAASLSVRRPGAVPSIPQRAEIDAALATGATATPTAITTTAGLPPG
ncbi:MAG: ribokinase [Desertimonas sp.]